MTTIHARQLVNKNAHKENNTRKLQNYFLLAPKNTALIPNPVKTSKLVDLF
jgi:hypothetical protein